MAKLLIVEDYVQTIKKIAKQFETINKNFQADSVFCFIPARGNNLEIQTISSLNLHPSLDRIDFAEQHEVVLNAILSFLKCNENDSILILIDVLLISPNPNAPSLEQYQLNKEYSCALYAELIKVKNGKYKTNHGISGKNISFVIYSRSDSILTVVAPTLKSLYTDEDRLFFPSESYLPKNISWCKNREEEVGTELDAQRQTPPLALPKSYTKYFSEM